MTSPGQGAARVARGGTLAAACLGMSVGAHVAAGGAVHMSAGVLAGGLALAVICVAAADARRSFGGILGVVLLSQVGLHLFAGAGGHHADPAGLGLTPAMVAFHGVAAVLVSLVLAHGERLVWALWSLARLPRVPRLGLVVPDAGAPRLVRDYRPVLALCRDLHLTGPDTRAPPAG
ncbi:hypothetical protein G1H11_06050 [Phytoactinopolyspora alkaliphila]|uniref:Uncharacterized protein n=1 Tax=Phytoactinopolyspora alkaliphila TaxID=1783498 RepID=A0A6N9YIJ6_9ACTN|nr:hypothetical protein [Phytoactinopolyspora alkaliphila]NED94871.1 hypothetical protein [Phytoactinopolyspora alkaliphila]